MKYTEGEISYLKEEDFTNYFMITLGARSHVIDILTIVHKNVSFDVQKKK
jgi:hypothetical protein